MEIKVLLPRRAFGCYGVTVPMLVKLHDTAAGTESCPCEARPTAPHDFSCPIRRRLGWVDNPDPPV